MSENTLHFSLKRPEEYCQLPKIVVMGVGGGGCNAINDMLSKDIEGVEFIAVNTDVQSLANSQAEKVIQLGKEITKGQGAGSYPEVGLAAAEESKEEIEEALDGVQLLFLTAGMGGGTGTGATPYIAKLAKEKDILTIAVVTKPFQYEAEVKLRIAEEGIAELRKYVDTMIVLPNENLFRIANKETKLQDAFASTNNVLYLGVKGITDLITTPGLINLDFADVRMVIKKMGRAMMGMGEAEGEDRAIKAVKEALSNPLLEDVNIKGATGALVNITGSPDITLFEFDEAAKKIREEIGGKDAIIKVGTAFTKELEGKIRVSIFATGMQESASDDYQFQDNRVEEESEEEQDIEDEHFEEEPKINDELPLENNTQSEEENKHRISVGKTKLTANSNDEFFDTGKPYIEEDLDMDDKKSDSLFFGLFSGFSKKKEKQNKIEPTTFKSKNREIEFETSNSKNNISEDILEIPAYLRKKKN